MATIYEAPKGENVTVDDEQKWFDNQSEAEVILHSDLVLKAHQLLTSL